MKRHFPVFVRNRTSLESKGNAHVSPPLVSQAVDICCAPAISRVARISDASLLERGIESGFRQNQTGSHCTRLAFAALGQSDEQGTSAVTNRCRGGCGG